MFPTTEAAGATFGLHGLPCGWVPCAPSFHKVCFPTPMLQPPPTSSVCRGAKAWVAFLRSPCYPQQGRQSCPGATKDRSLGAGSGPSSASGRPGSELLRVLWGRSPMNQHSQAGNSVLKRGAQPRSQVGRRGHLGNPIEAIHKNEPNRSNSRQMQGFTSLVISEMQTQTKFRFYPSHWQRFKNSMALQQRAPCWSPRKWARF